MRDFRQRAVVVALAASLALAWSVPTAAAASSAIRIHPMGECLVFK